MKPRFISLWTRIGIGASLLIGLQFMLAGNAAAAGHPPDSGYALFRLRPTAPASVNTGRSPGRRETAHQMEGLDQHSSQATTVSNTSQNNSPDPQSDFSTFAASVSNGQSGVVRGVYVPGILALRVVQQSESAPYYVSLAKGTATQYRAASTWGVTGLLADDVASGTLFYSLAPGQEVRLVQGDGAVQIYHVSGLYRFQALSPNDPYSDFVDLGTGERISAVELFSRMYTGSNHVTLQTCIPRDGIMSWGRLFVVATPG